MRSGDWSVRRDAGHEHELLVSANTSAGCTGVTGTVGAQTGRTAIIFGNTAGQIEMSHSAAMGALVSASGIGAVANQTATGIFPNGSMPIAYAASQRGRLTL
jgi:hypothetical protein